jgi:hypothetical protein
MGAISWPSIGYYCVFSIFVYYQKRHAQTFKGSSAVFGSVLTFFAIVGTLVGVSYLIYYGWTVSWWVPIVALLLGALAGAPAGMLENLVGALTFSLAGFVVWPLAAYMMFHYVPN